MSVHRIQPKPTDPPEKSITPRERKRLETRERLFESALEEFREAGFGAAQIDRIVERAGVARGTFYFHFPTKEHVLLEVQRRGQAAIVEVLRSQGEHPRDPRAFLRLIFDTILGSLEIESELRRELMGMYVRQPMNLELINEPLIVEVVDYFAEAAERRAIRRDIAPEQLAVHFLSSLFSLLSVPDDDLHSEKGRENFDLSIELFLNGATTREE